MIEHALAYAARGFRVFPLHTPDAAGRCSCHKPECANVGKHPRTMNGLTDATDNTEAVSRWWSMWPDANIAIATGAETGFVVVDVDPRHGGKEALKALLDAHGELTEKLYVATGGGGWHLLFKHPGFTVRNIQNRPERLGAGIDFRGDGGYVVAAPSLHASGQRYAWGKGCENADAPEMPEWLKTLLHTPQTSAPVFSDEAGQVAQGDRHKYLTSLAGSMRRRGMSAEAMYAALSVENSRACVPPKSDEEIQKIAHSIAKYSPDDPAYIFPERVTLEGERPDGIYRVSELSDEIDALYEKGRQRGATTGWAGVDVHYTVKRGQWTIVTGMPSHGKSSVLSALLVNLAIFHGWRFAICSPENQPLADYAAELMSIWSGEPFDTGVSGRMSRATLAEAKAWLDEHFVFVLPDEGGCTVGGILERALYVHNEKPIHGLVIDPWNELEHRRPSNMNETEYVSQSLTRMRRFARDNELHLWLVAHPTKLQKDIKTQTYPVATLYDISGSAHFYNKADFGLSVWRDVKNENEPTQVHVQKARFRWCGKPGVVELYFDVTNGRFTETRPVYFPEYARDEEETEKPW